MVGGVWWVWVVGWWVVVGWWWWVAAVVGDTGSGRDGQSQAARVKEYTVKPVPESEAPVRLSHRRLKPRIGHNKAASRAPISGISSSVLQRLAVVTALVVESGSNRDVIATTLAKECHSTVTAHSQRHSTQHSHSTVQHTVTAQSFDHLGQ